MTYQLDGLVTGDQAIRGTAAHDAWRDWCSNVHGEFGITFDTDSYRGRVIRQRSATYQLVGWTGEKELVKRERQGIRRDPRGHYELFVPLSGELRVGQESADHRLNPGEMTLVPIDAPFHVGHGDGARALTLLIPFDRIDQRLGTVSPRGQRVIGNKGIARVTRDLLASLLREREDLSGSYFDAACDRVVDLFCLAAVGDEHLPATSGAAVRDAVRRYIRQHATEPELTLPAIAAAIGWSPRYIQAVLARENTTATDLIRAERLELARNKLANPAFAAQTITAIATSVGFHSASSFSTAYRRRFGHCPRDTRNGFEPG
ncbi:AraC-like DNA-binding protein [Kibdelosporangium banguiense]|uniref:AraC-like DNA-binding protein n=1 Tax=Kibdelosporangium banguiense TaxID=1365924 RepID=A0ABS4TYC4_9PSEU|nr:helix-turn-helix domain-containing protein [Kibdelosporangium banguiense]MBP2329018.1 AraC-like DNA-binding protein [Kibdelosporangium banguiense]